ncbi:MAG: 5-(carboxyamino)imidazole ribonucleotide synthase [Bacteroidetes bacterium]|nr:5-(carboxyamino)imidazole ribonucleotide synthase [Bacteroidota bacterium]
MILPGSMLGMLGGGQLGRMFTVAARTMGYKVTVLDPDSESPAGLLADTHLCADYHDKSALEELGSTCAVVTTEFENVPSDTLDLLSKSVLVRPSAFAVSMTQDRINEKNFLRQNALPTNKYAPVYSASDLSDAVKVTGLPALLKRSRLGYDGKGQVRIQTLGEAEEAFEQMGGVPCVLEELLSFQCEVSVVLSRGIDGEISTYPTAENIHTNGILDLTIVPARVSEELAQRAQDVATKVAQKLGYYGVMAVEMFVMPDRRVLVNEIAPRPHNSGHYTLDACATDQFEQQVRTVCGLPPGSTTLLSPVVMKNLLGDIWEDSEPKWDVVLQQPSAKLHLYGKKEARPGRKMGHFNLLADEVENALDLAQSVFDRIR